VTPARWGHVVWIWMENASYSEIVGNPAAPYLNRLASECGLATHYTAITHPSLPNYLAATSGSDWGIRDDGPPSVHRLGQESLFAQLAAAGLSWRAYEESMPWNCAVSSTGLYAVKHNPAAYYTSIRAQCAKRDVPMGTVSAGRFASDLRSGRLPSFSFVTPNLCDDMHDCSTATGDAWLKRWIQRIVSSRQYKSGTTVVFVTFDEGDGGSNRVATVVVSPTTPPGTRSAVAFSHYSLLRTTEQLLGIHRFLALAGDRSTASMRRAFHLEPPRR
jgi:phosphatidylinositol-3-phosphatase